MYKWVLFVLTTATAVSMAASQKVVGGPFVVNATSRSATVVWIVQTDESTLSPAGAAAGAPKTAPSLRVEKTTYTGLRPGTRYDYTVAGADALKGSFQTPPASEGPYKFVVFGDTRTRSDVHRQVVDALVKHGMPDFAVHTGDLVADGNDSALWPIFFDIEKELLRHAAFFPSLGNHERNCRAFYDFFQMEGPYYSFNWGNAHFIVMNSDVPNAASSPRARDSFWAEQVKWLEEDLAANQKAEFRFVVAHHPPFSAVSNRQSGNPWMTALVPMFEKYHVSAGFFGHDHNYQHYLKNGVHYIVTGGGGAPLYDVDRPPAGIVKAAVTENWVTVSVNGKAAHFEALAPDGTKLEEIEIQGSGQK